MIHRFEAFLTGITLCYKYIQRIKNAEMTELGLKGTHVACMFFLYHCPGELTSSQLCSLCCEDKASIPGSWPTCAAGAISTRHPGKITAPRCC